MNRSVQLPELSSRINEELDFSYGLSAWLESNLTFGTELPGDDARAKACLAFSHIALEHREAVVALAALNARTSFGPLLRAMLDATVKALWCRKVAEQALIARLVAGNENHQTFKKMIAQLRKLGFKSADALQETYSMLSDYAHSEHRQLSRWLGSSTIEPSYEDAEVVECLGLANRIGMLAAIEREQVVGEERLQPFFEKALEVAKRMDRIKAESQQLLASHQA